MFEHIGQIVYPLGISTADGMLETAIEVGAEDCVSDKEHHTVTCTMEQFGAVRDGLEKRFGTPESAKMLWHPKITTPVDEEQAKSILKLIETLEDNDDVQEVFSNFEISDAILQKLSA